MSALPSSSSSLTRKTKREFAYDIFLSFNGDTRQKFTDHLHTALIEQGIETFKDDKSLEKGENFAPELLEAIGNSWGSIIVISKGYAFSRWCLKELVEIMKQREKRGHRVYPIFYDVEASDLQYQKNSVEDAFNKHKTRHGQETVEGWRVALKEVTSINGWSLKQRGEAGFIKDIVDDVSKKVKGEILDEQEVETMKTNFRMIKNWLVVAENNQYMKKREEEREVLKDWLDKLKHIDYDMGDVLDEWNTVILKSNIEKDQPQTPSSPPSEVDDIPSASFHFGGISLLHDITLKIKELNKKYQSILKQKDDFPFVLDRNTSYTDLERPKTGSLIDESVVYGRDHDKDTLIHLLLSDDNVEGGSGNGIPLLAIVGMGGLGKTTLAQLAYNNDKVKNHFDRRIWVCASDPFDEVRIAKAIVEALTRAPSKFNELQGLLEEIQEAIAGKKFLLVLDDVWTEDERKWEQLKLSLGFGFRESKILVTTRNEKVANILGCPRPFLLGVLSGEDSLSLFSKIAFSGRSNEDHENLKSIGRECVKKCKGLPLAIKALAGLLRFKRSREQWQKISDSRLWELDEVENGLFSPLLLSYYDLPPPLRQCFSYCAIFPKDHVMEKDMLIKSWMAQGFLGETQGNEMEIIGEEYFDNLATRSFFQELEKYFEGDSIIFCCKMHDIVHDFAQLLRKTECCVVPVASNGVEEQRADVYLENVRHLTFILDGIHVAIPDAIYNVKKLRSLLLVGPRWFDSTSSLEASLPKLLDQLTCLRMLNLSWLKLKELPQEIRKLIHLRYLSLKGNGELSELPEALCDLCNLQTLNVRQCTKLQKLPCGMGKLINLRHLQNSSLGNTYFPKGMWRLTCLQTLEQVSQEKKGGGIESETSFSLEDLGKLIHLRGQLEIRGLANVGDASEAREARLSTKAGLRKLTLSFDFGGGYDEMLQRKKHIIENEAFVLEALHPPQHLQVLKIECCQGSAFPFPNWMTSLTSLKSVELSNCDNWESLPPMGKLPSLESLSIRNMWKVKKVGEEFVGVETSSSFSSSSSVNHNIIAFPNLKTLQFGFITGWEEWEYENVLRSRGGDDSSYSFSNTITIMPKLQCLSMFYCTKLKTLPRHLLQSSALQDLRIIGSPIIFERFNKETGDEWPSISHIPTVEIEE